MNRRALQVISEGWALALALCAPLLALLPELLPRMAQQGMFFAAAAASLWVSARLPHPGASLRRVAGFTLLHGLIYSSGMIALFATVNAWLQRASAGMGLAAGDAPLSGPE